MSIGLDGYRGASGDRVILATDPNTGNVTGVRKADLKFRDRVVGSREQDGSFWDGTAAQQAENRQFKQQFYQALVKSNGAKIADLAAKEAGLPRNWKDSGSAISGRQVRQILDKTDMLRKHCLDENERFARDFLKNRGTDNFRAVFAFQGSHAGLPAADLKNPQLHALFMREVKRDPNYGKGVMDPVYLRSVAQRAIRKFGEQQRDACREQYPSLANFVQSDVTGGVHENPRAIFHDLDARLDPNTANGDPLGQEPAAFRKAAQSALSEISTVKDLLSEMKYDPDGWRALSNELGAKFSRLESMEQELTNMAPGDLPQSEAGAQLYRDLVGEIRHQKDLLIANASFIDDVRDNDPLSKKCVAHSNLCWAQAVGHVIDRAADQLRATNPDAASVLDQRKLAYITQQTTAYEQAPLYERTIIPGTVDKNAHPVALGKKDAKDFLVEALQQAGLPPDEIATLTGKKSLDAAIRKVANESPQWAPYRADIVVTRDGLTRTYRSKITPAACVNPRFARRYASDQPLDGANLPHEPRLGVSSMTKADHYHARNLKASELVRPNADGTEEDLGTVIGNGVLDMWDIADPQQRAEANERGAKEVLELALAKNDRIRHEALNRAATGDDRPVKMVHVSVNLTTPSGVRELPILKSQFVRELPVIKDKIADLPDYQELTYTREQFRAFEANTSAGQGRPSVEFQVDDDRVQPSPGGDRGQDSRINVDVDSISFSFGINPLATGKWVPEFAGGWHHVYEHNRAQMEKFIGDLGDGKFGSRGAEPGGFIGSVYDRLDDPDNEDQMELRASIREQTDLVREMFTTESFKRGNGDPAKMGRHILYLQGLAEKALKLLNVTDLAATMSKGCKSDKDRGGMTDGELKNMIITEDMGGQITPDQELEGDDRTNYARNQSLFGGEWNQKASAIVPGSKELGHHAGRIGDPRAVEYLAGLGEQSAD